MPIYSYKCACGEEFEELRSMGERDSLILCPTIREEGPNAPDGILVCRVDAMEKANHIVTRVFEGTNYMCVNESKVGPGEVPGTEALYKRHRSIGNDSVGRIRVDKMMRKHHLIGDGDGGVKGSAELRAKAASRRRRR